MEAIDRLKLRLGITDTDKDDLLNEYLLMAEETIEEFLNMETLDSRFVSKQIELAKIFYSKDQLSDPLVKSESYTEGVVKEDTTYLSSTEYDSMKETLLSSIKRYRRVYARSTQEDSTEEE